jgi:hypothetical protein
MARARRHICARQASVSASHQLPALEANTYVDGLRTARSAYSRGSLVPSLLPGGGRLEDSGPAQQHPRSLGSLQSVYNEPPNQTDHERDELDAQQKQSDPCLMRFEQVVVLRQKAPARQRVPKSSQDEPDTRSPTEAGDNSLRQDVKVPARNRIASRPPVALEEHVAWRDQQGKYQCRLKGRKHGPILRIAWVDLFAQSDLQRPTRPTRQLVRGQGPAVTRCAAAKPSATAATKAR